MADLDTELNSLREHMLAAIPQPDLVRVAARSRQRVMRRRMQLGAAVAVLVVSTAVPVLRAQSTGDDPTATPPSADEQPGSEGYSFEYADATHGYALRDRCSGGPPPVDCDFDLLVTANGRTWERREVPPAKVPNVAYPGLLVLGPDSLVINYSIEATGPEAMRYFSSDAGRTWRPVAEPVGSTAVSAIPTGAPLVMYCLPGTTPTPQCDDVGTVLPESGQTVPLATQPPLDDIRPGKIPTEGGSWWVAGRDPATLDWMVAVSRDAGRTWSTGNSPRRASSTTATGRRSSSWAPSCTRSSTAPRACSRSLRAPTAAPPGPERGTARTCPTSLPGGRRRRHTARALHRGRADLRQHRWRANLRRDPRRLNGMVEWTRAGYVETSESVWGTRYRLSTDGVNWREIKIG